MALLLNDNAVQHPVGMVNAKLGHPLIDGEEVHAPADTVGCGEAVPVPPFATDKGSGRICAIEGARVLQSSVSVVELDPPVPTNCSVP